MRSVCVFCGSSSGARPAYEVAAVATGRAIAEAGLTLVYGGARVGLMGSVADGALGAGGRVIGVLPKALQDKELAHMGLSELHIVGSMHERKAMMADLSDAFMALPGGAGTLEELFEIWTWGQLGYHRKPCGFLNVDGFYDGLLAFLDLQVEEGFVRPEMRHMVQVGATPQDLLAAFAAYRPPATPKWIERTET
ncbi:TIGR00730 family Rossman fold protein [Polymorphum gilvum]|uniref:Cytokinin riboside 5'-monophosphate phosphoribohydrolase n=1 Tax=Polymorphum gilvum (strain LMG 25793 / CGMCC 1.9160 / SL003B-26A1) TaxID=991905 RepID=F2IV80_POLGS|nr:TIGR00730 family Rossman fold protein [Polymorphum gilvum]ADZ71411.1 decarboxylase family protein [Polymorphum gilvum SL003B-26A1]